MFSKVAEFHRTFELAMSEEPVFPSRSLRDLRIRILVEEWDELKEANAADDIIEIADALADMAYLICGSSLVYGIAPKNLEYVPLFSNFPLSGKPSLPEATQRTAIHTKIDKAFAKYLLAEEANDLSKVLTTLQDLMVCVSEAAYVYNIPLIAVFNEVHRSNMSKLDENGKPLYREDGKVMKSVLFTPPDIKGILFPS